MNKQKSVIIGLLLILIMLSGGCFDDSEPPSYPPSYKGTDINVELNYDYPIFYFGDVVQDNGSVNISKTTDWTLTITNLGSISEEVRFEIVDFPQEILIWSTIVEITERNITFSPEYDYYDNEFDRYWIEDISANTSLDFIVSITFNKTVAWSYNPDTTYVGHFEIGYRIRKHYDTYSSIYYKELIVPFVVRT